MTTTFLTVPPTPEGVKQIFARPEMPLIIVSRHGLGDNVFLSPCFERLSQIFPKLFFCSSVNAYTSLFHESRFVRPLYCGGVNGGDLGLDTVDGFARHFRALGLDLGVATAQVYHYGLFEPDVPYTSQQGFVKGRRNFVEFFGAGPLATEVPRYHAAPDKVSKEYVGHVLNRWLPGRELIVVGRYGHTDPEKNFGDDSRETLSLVKSISKIEPGRFKFLSLDYIPGDHAADGRAANLRSVYGFLPCDAAAMHHLLCHAKVLVTVPSGPMLVGATIPELKLLTLWKTMTPYHFLDPQFDSRNRVYALVDEPGLADTSFMANWPAESQASLLARWQVQVATITTASVVAMIMEMLVES